MIAYERLKKVTGSYSLCFVCLVPLLKTRAHLTCGAKVGEAQ
jgi:hypothetical protein